MSNEKQQESLYSKELFNEEMQMIDDQIDDLNNLYNEIKTHFDKVKNSQFKGSLTFIKDQTNNLISIKTAKLNYIKQKADLKKNVTDFAFKEKSISNKETTEGIDAITTEIYKKIASDFKYVPDKSDDTNHYDNSDHIEAILDDELVDLNIDSIVENSTSIEEVNVDYTSDNSLVIESNEEILPSNLDENSEDEKNENSIIVVDLDTLTFYELDKTSFELIEELGFIEKIIDTTEIDDEIYAIGESGTVYLTVVFEDEE